MMYDWDIDIWAQQQIPEELQQDPEPLLSDILFRLKPLKMLNDEFAAFRTYIIKKMRYNSQTIILRNLLNDLFDPNDRRIRVITTYDIIKPVYIYNDSENETPIYTYTDGELTFGNPHFNAHAEITYIYNKSELGVLYDFIVEAAPGSLTTEQIVRLKAIVNYYRLFGKKPGYFYSDSTPY